MSGVSPRISVGMPVYNGERYIDEAINCVLNQTYGDFELIISDNASTDRTEQICREYASQDKRIVYMRNKENLGAAINYNIVFQKARGPYFRWFNVDDACAPELHEKCTEVLDANPDVVLCYGKTVIIDSEGSPIEKYDDNLNLQQKKASDRFVTFFCSVGLTNVIYGLMRTSAVAKTMLMGNGSFYAADNNFMAEMTLYGKFIEIPEPLFFRRMHEKASSWDRKNNEVQQDFWKGAKKDFILPHWKKNIALLKAVLLSPVGFKEKLVLGKYLMRKMIRSRDKLIKDIYHYIT